jgi:transcriptional regulator with XRE-family HTH domain
LLEEILFKAAMTFYDLRQHLLENLRCRVHSGEATERGLAKRTGVSQPHLHNVLKGKRILSYEKADEILARLDLNVLDLIPPPAIAVIERRR